MDHPKVPQTNDVVRDLLVYTVSWKYSRAFRSAVELVPASHDVREIIG